jgi:hypothetical protein
MINGRKIPSTFAAYLKIIFIAMQKSEYISMPEAGKNGCKVSMASMKVSKANAQSRGSGILFAPANSKLYFAVLKMLSVPQNNLPRVGEGNAPKSHFHQKQSPLKSQKYGNRKKQTSAGRA